jgi:hypothetical protein
MLICRINRDGNKILYHSELKVTAVPETMFSKKNKVFIRDIPNATERKKLITNIKQMQLNTKKMEKLDIALSDKDYSMMIFYRESGDFSTFMEQVKLGSSL